MICWECGKEFEFHEDFRRYYCCENCEGAAKARERDERDKYFKYKFIHMHETALKLLENKTEKFSQYKKACDAIYKIGIDSPCAFDSSDEILAAIIFLTSGYHVKTQVKVESYRVDFFLQSQKTIVEIDGNMHTSKILSDSNRDKKIREILGSAWEIVRIPTNLLRANPEMLIEAVRAIRKEKVEVRNKNGGIIPAYYSRQAQARIQAIEDVTYAKMIH